MDSEVYIGADGLAKLGRHRIKNKRRDSVRNMRQQIDYQLYEEFVKKTIATNRNGWNILLAYLASESEPPLLVTNSETVDERRFILAAAKSEGVSHIYEKLVKLEEKLREEEEKENGK